MVEIKIQDYLFQSIREKLRPGDSLSEAVASLLYVSSDSAYRRIRGETPLVLEEAKTLCDAYGLSLDQLLQSRPDSISVQYTQVANNRQSFQHYLQGILTNLNMLSGAITKEIIYLTKDIPVFYNFLYRPLFSFRYFFWMKSILQDPDFINAKFSVDCLPKDIESMGTEINRVYNNIPSSEIWNSECINSTISQIEYYREAGYFRSSAEIENVYEALRCLIEHMRDQAESGSKFLPGENATMKRANFQFYHNRVVLGDNTIIAVANGRKLVYLSYDVLNYITTTDENFCGNVYEKVQMLMRRATVLSRVSEKQRSIFFNILLKKIPGRIGINNKSI
ncbi:MAG TPA: hypothetical protein VNR87_01095 [Flavisolibacter sp.]|nr:hypothetical protein [Flavisolibacter sp.]